MDNTGDYVSENANEGTDTVLSSITYTLGGHVEQLTLTGSAAINGTGNSLDNLLTGNTAVNILNGGAGKDILDGRAGNDALNGGTGSDLYLFNRTGGVDTIGDYSTNLGDIDILRLTEGIGKSDPVLVKQNNDLYLFLGESNYVRIENQFQNKDYGVESLEVSGGYYMTRSDIEDLVDTMGDINNNPGMDAFEKYDAMLVDQVYASTLAQSWQL